MKALVKAVALIVAALLLAPALARADVLKIVLHDTIQPIADEFIERALEQAKRERDEAVLIELSTPGGLVDSTRSIIEKMLASPVPVILRGAQRRARGVGGLFHPGSGRHRRYGPGHQHRRRSPGGLRRREDGRRDEGEDGKRCRRLHVLLRLQART